MGNFFGLNRIEDDVSWVAAASVEEVLKRQIFRNGKDKKKHGLPLYHQR